MKNKKIGEVNALAAAGLPIELRRYGRRVFFKSRTCEFIDILKDRKSLEAFKKAMELPEYSTFWAQDVLEKYQGTDDRAR